MGNGELVIHDSNAAMTADQVKAQVRLIQDVMRSVMKDGTHFGIIPGCKQPSLYKPGSETLLTTFRIAVEPEVEDLSTSDEIRYRVKALGRHQKTGIVVGIGVGECSSNEEKYRWRKAFNEQEYNEAPDDARRLKWKKYQGNEYQERQIRTNPADVANTILKMAKKRAQIDLTLTCTAASDIFTQDVEDMPAEVRESIHDEAAKPPIKEPQAKPSPPPADADKITEPQRKKIWAILHKTITTDELKRAKVAEILGVEKVESLNSLTKKEASAVIEALQKMESGTKEPPY